MSIQDVPRVWRLEGEEILAIPTGIENEIRQALIHRDQEGHGRDAGGDNVQIVEKVVCVSKEQMITLAGNGMGGTTSRFRSI